MQIILFFLCTEVYTVLLQQCKHYIIFFFFLDKQLLFILFCYHYTQIQ